MILKTDIVCVAAFVLALVSCEKNERSENPVSDEVIYHVVQRSFYDANGDRHGDLKGLEQKLDYLQSLGVTSILMLPLYESIYYHNYFADDFEKIDGEFGTMADYLDLVKAVHKRGMKIYMDMETQYITEEHKWYKDAYANPGSPFTPYLIFNGPANTKPEPIVWDIIDLPGYDGKVRKVTTVNLLSPEVMDYNFKLFSYWVDPNDDGNFDDGVDGFRLDHMMDDLDGKGKLKDLFSVFWRPMLTKLKEKNPKLLIIAEQADWASLGVEYLTNAAVDKVFAFWMQHAIASFDKEKIVMAADSTFSKTPRQLQQIVFIENHDMKRFSAAAGNDLQKLKAGAGLNLLLGGTPSIYYGQELGMRGAGGFGKFGNTDGNDIPQREAFEWYATVDTAGMALWYRDSGPWWDQTNLQSNDGISLEEQKEDPASLWNFYHKLIMLRKTYPVLIDGNYETVKNTNENVFSFRRTNSHDALVVLVNLSAEKQDVSMPGSKPAEVIFGDGQINSASDSLKAYLPPYSVTALK